MQFDGAKTVSIFSRDACAIALSVYLTCIGNACADIKFSPSERATGYHTSGTVVGTIKSSDFDLIRAALKVLRADDTFSLFVNTAGGDVDTALKIGKLLRDSRASVRVHASDVCLSACVLILAGAKQRQVDSQEGARVGIHRPYDPNDQETTMEGQKRKQQQWEQRIKAFLNEVNVPVALYDEMIRVPLGQMRILSVAELSRFGLNSNDPYWEDASETLAARQYGLTKAEYLRRKGISKTLCAKFKTEETPYDDIVCEANILRGLRPDLNIGRR